nr:NnrS family protein [uncultured Halomonas sp.]
MMHSVLSRTMPLWRLAFRPFFLLGAAFSLLAMLMWGAFWNGVPLLQPHGGMFWWHQHEMLFGFVAAIVVGFLLTAVGNWTGQPGLRGVPLLALVGLWLSGRLLMAVPLGLSPWALMLVDVAFLPLAAMALAAPVIRVRQWRNLIFVPLLALLALSNALTHYALMLGDAMLLRGSAHLAVLLVAMLMVVLGGRVIPFFTSRRLQRSAPTRRAWLEAVAIGGVAALVLAQLAELAGPPIPARGWAALAFIAGVANAVRLLRWEGWRSWREPLLWGLHVSYAFIGIGLLMWGLAALEVVTASLAVHALTVGGMATMILAMISRVSLGHTGRSIVTLPGIGIALALLVLAAVSRALLPAFWPQASHWALNLAILFWCLAFSIYLYRYSCMLLKRRADGAEG